MSSSSVADAVEVKQSKRSAAFVFLESTSIFPVASVGKAERVVSVLHRKS